MLAPHLLLAIIAGHFLLLVLIAHWTSGDSRNSAFFLADRKAPWWLVAIGTVGATISGITFISVPGAVGTAGVNREFSYMQFIFGTMVGYFVTAFVLLPVYYRMSNLRARSLRLSRKPLRRDGPEDGRCVLHDRPSGGLPSMRLYLLALWRCKEICTRTCLRSPLLVDGHRDSLS